MAETSVKIKTPIDIATILINCRNDFNRAKSMILSRRNELSSIPTTFADYVGAMASVDVDAPGTSAISIARRQEFDELVAEYVALSAELETALAALGVSF